MTNLVFVCLFTVEMVVKMYSLGIQVSWKFLKLLFKYLLACIIYDL